MSHNDKPGRGSSPKPTPFAISPADVHLDVDPRERERVAQLIALNKSRQALDVAKDLHERCPTATSEALLLDAYGARFASLIKRRLDREATALLDLVSERYPSARERLREWNADF